MGIVRTPYRVCPLGAHVDHQHGLITGFAIDRGVELEYEKTEDGSVTLTSKNYSGILEFNLNEELPEREFFWGDFFVGAVVTLRRKYEITRGINGIVRGTLPVGGLSSSAAVILTYLQVLCDVNNIAISKHELVKMAIWEENNYIGVSVGKLDQSCEVYCKKDSLLYLDTQDDSMEIISKHNNMPDFDIAIIFSGVERKLAGSAYNMRVDECKSAAYALKAFAEMEYGKYSDTYLRDIPRGIYEDLKDKLPRNWAKRAKHYYEENERVKKGAIAWKNGDIETFGKLIFESGYSSIYEYETGSGELKTLYNIMKETKGVYGGRFSGAGFNGCSMAITNPEMREYITKYITEEYLKVYPDMKDKFEIHFCKTADGINAY